MEILLLQIELSQLFFSPKTLMFYVLTGVCLQVDVLFAAKVLGDWNAVEVLANLTVLDGADVKEQDESNENEDGEDEAEPKQDNLPPPVVDPEGDKGEDGVGHEEPEDEAEEVGVVVNPGQKAGEEEDRGHAHQLQHRHLGVLEAGPLVDHLDDGGGEDAEMGSGRPHLGPVGHKDGGGEVADHARAEVDEGKPLGADQLLEVANQPVVEGQGHHQVENPTKYAKILGAKQPLPIFCPSVQLAGSAYIVYQSALFSLLKMCTWKMRHGGKLIIKSAKDKICVGFV